MTNRLCLALVAWLAVAGLGWGVGYGPYLEITEHTCEVDSYLVTEVPVTEAEHGVCDYDSSSATVCSKCNAWPLQCCNWQATNPTTCFRMKMWYSGPDSHNVYQIDCQTDLDCQSSARQLVTVSSGSGGSGDLDLLCYTSGYRPGDSLDKPPAYSPGSIAYLVGVAVVAVLLLGTIIYRRLHAQHVVTRSRLLGPVRPRSTYSTYAKSANPTSYQTYSNAGLGYARRMHESRQHAENPDLEEGQTGQTNPGEPSAPVWPDTRQPLPYVVVFSTSPINT